MGILGKIRLGWKALPLKEKIGLVLDVISGAGCGILSFTAGKKLSEGCGPIETICIKTATIGLGLAASEVSSKALRENYGDTAAEMIERAKAKAAEQKAKEAVVNE